MGHKRKGERAATFAEIVGEAEAAGMEPAGPWGAWTQPISGGEFTDDDGVQWHVRGDGLPPWKRVEKLLKDPQVRVLHVYQNEVRDVLPADRESFAAEIRPYLIEPDVRVRGDYTDYFATEFKNDLGNYLLTVDESC